MVKTIKLDDITNALEIIHKNTPPDKVIKTEWGYILLDGLGTPKKIQLDKEVAEQIKLIFFPKLDDEKREELDLNLAQLFGIPIVVSRGIGELE